MPRRDYYFRTGNSKDLPVGILVNGDFLGAAGYFMVTY